MSQKTRSVSASSPKKKFANDDDEDTKKDNYRENRIRNLASRVEVTRMSGACYPYIRVIIDQFMYRFLRHAYMHMIRDKRLEMMPKDIEFAARAMGYSMANIPFSDEDYSISKCTYPASSKTKPSAANEVSIDSDETKSAFNLRDMVKGALIEVSKRQKDIMLDVQKACLIEDHDVYRRLLDRMTSASAQRVNNDLGRPQLMTKTKWNKRAVVASQVVLEYFLAELLMTARNFMTYANVPAIQGMGIPIKSSSKKRVTLMAIDLNHALKAIADQRPQVYSNTDKYPFIEDANRKFIKVEREEKYIQFPGARGVKNEIANQPVLSSENKRVKAKVKRVVRRRRTPAQRK